MRRTGVQKPHAVLLTSLIAIGSDAAGLITRKDMRRHLPTAAMDRARLETKQIFWK
jgi:hypothetical protein